MKTSGLFCNERLMFVHSASFVLASVFSMITFCLTINNADLKRDQSGEIQAIRLNISGLSLGVVAMLSYFVLACLMLVIFIKYGKPLEEDALIIIQEKLQ